MSMSCWRPLSRARRIFGCRCQTTCGRRSNAALCTMTRDQGITPQTQTHLPPAISRRISSIYTSTARCHFIGPCTSSPCAKLACQSSYQLWNRVLSSAHPIGSLKPHSAGPHILANRSKLAWVRTAECNVRSVVVDNSCCITYINCK